MSEQLLQQILEKLNKMDDSIQKLQADVTDIPLIKQAIADIPLIKQVVIETADTVKRIESNQERHERILEVLSIRSIEQEAAINRIK